MGDRHASVAPIEQAFEHAAAVRTMDVQMFADAPAGGGDAMAAQRIVKGDMAQVGVVEDGVQSSLLVAGQFGHAAHTGTSAGRAGRRGDDSVVGHGGSPVGEWQSAHYNRWLVLEKDPEPSNILEPRCRGKCHGLQPAIRYFRDRKST